MGGYKFPDGPRTGWSISLPTSIEPDENPVAITLHPNYPNPFNPSTVISYQLAEISEVRVEVFNMLGQQVAIPVDYELQPAGIHNVTFNAKGSNSGVYHYHLIVRQADFMNLKTEVATGKMLLIK